MQLSHHELLAFRQLGDTPTDELYQAASPTLAEHRSFHAFLAQPWQAEPSDALARQFWQQSHTLLPRPNPIWLAKLRKGQYFFIMHRSMILWLLGTYALPYCYAAADGAKVLSATGYLVNDPFRRLRETTRFVLSVAQHHRVASAAWLTTVLKVRWMHTLVRQRLMASGWDCQRHAMPINQLDMLGTTLAFGWLPIKAMRRLGYSFDVQLAEAYWQLWRFVGECMGVYPDLLPQSLTDCYGLDVKIRDCCFAASPEGHDLFRALDQAFLAHLPPPMNRWASQYLHALLQVDCHAYLPLRPEKVDRLRLRSYFLAVKPFLGL